MIVQSKVGDWKGRQVFEVELAKARTIVADFGRNRQRKMQADDFHPCSGFAVRATKTNIHVYLVRGSAGESEEDSQGLQLTGSFSMLHYVKELGEYVVQNVRFFNAGQTHVETLEADL